MCHETGRLKIAGADQCFPKLTCGYPGLGPNAGSDLAGLVGAPDPVSLTSSQVTVTLQVHGPALEEQDPERLMVSVQNTQGCYLKVGRREESYQDP